MPRLKGLLAAICGSLLLTIPAQAQGVKPPEDCGLSLCPLDDAATKLLQAEGYKLVTVPSEGIEQSMPIGTTEAKGIPDTVQGIWWIDVSFFPGILATLGGDSTWDPQLRTAYMRVFGAKSFSYHHTTAGESLYLTALSNHFAFNFKFSDDNKFVSIILNLEILGMQIPIPEGIVRFQMRLVEDGHFVRESWLFGQRLSDYQLRRIVRADGSHDPAYEAYLLSADKESFLAERIE